MIKYDTLKDLENITFDGPVIKKQRAEEIPYVEDLKTLYDKAQEQIDIRSDQAHSEGYKKGFEAGRKEGKEVKAFVNTRISVIKTHIESIVNESISKVINTEQDANPYISSVVSDIVDRYCIVSAFKLRISPQVDADSLKRIRQDLKGLMLNCRVVQDPHLSPDEFILDSDETSFHFSLEYLFN